jgi:hypothetical protein
LFRGKAGAYFFVMDAVFAGIILISAIYFIFTSYANQPERQTTLRAGEDFANFLYSTRIREFNTYYVDSLVNNGTINNTEITLAEQMLRFYYAQDNNTLVNFTQDVASIIMQRDRGLLVFLNKSLIYNSTVHKHASTMNSSRLLVSTKRISYAKVNQSTVIGPIWMEVKVWV